MGKSFHLRMWKVNLRICKGEDLPVMDVRTSDPYIVIQYQGKSFATTIKKSTLSPEWNENFSFQAEPPVYGNLYFTMYDKDAVKDDIMGNAFIPLHIVQPLKLHEIYLNLKSSDKSQFGGRVLVQLEVVPDGNQAFSSPPPEQKSGALFVKVNKAFGIPKTDLVGKTDPYVVLTLSTHDNNNKAKIKAEEKKKEKFKTGTNVFKTKTIQENDEPVWNEKFKLEFQPKQYFRFLVYDEDVKFDDLVGFVSFPVSLLQEHLILTASFQIVTIPGIKDGESHLNVTLYVGDTVDQPPF
uniref:C2 domain-containing protein n=1 Tax=Coptotermes formosanus TaxID=36987 RepID=R4UV46_COPFO|nr:C2 domain-containing protein [Coptotermes formosanus]